MTAVSEHKDTCCQAPEKPAHYYSREEARKAQCCATCHEASSYKAFADVISDKEDYETEQEG